MPHHVAVVGATLRPHTSATSRTVHRLAMRWDWPDSHRLGSPGLLGRAAASGQPSCFVRPYRHIDTKLGLRFVACLSTPQPQVWDASGRIAGARTLRKTGITGESDGPSTAPAASPYHWYAVDPRYPLE